MTMMSYVRAKFRNITKKEIYHMTMMSYVRAKFRNITKKEIYHMTMMLECNLKIFVMCFGL